MNIESIGGEFALIDRLCGIAGIDHADLITGVDSEFSTLAWVNAPQRRWEPEPLRWRGIWRSRF